MSEEKKCPICGEPTYLVYGKHPRKDGLCKKHSQMLFNGELAECEKCKTFANLLNFAGIYATLLVINILFIGEQL